MLSRLNRNKKPNIYRLYLFYRCFIIQFLNLLLVFFLVIDFSTFSISKQKTKKVYMIRNISEIFRIFNECFVYLQAVTQIHSNGRL